MKGTTNIESWKTRVAKDGDTMSGRLTAEGRITVTSDGGSMMHSKDSSSAAIQVTPDIPLDWSGFYPIISGNSTDGSTWCIGIISNTLYIGYYDAAETRNQMTKSIRFPLSTKDGVVAVTSELPTDFVSKANGGTFDNHITIDRHKGTTTTDGESALLLGNNLPSGTDGNSYGDVYFYDTSKYYLILQTDPLTGYRNVYLPNGSGTLALVSQIPTNNNQLTNGAGYVTTNDIHYLRRDEWWVNGSSHDANDLVGGMTFAYAAMTNTATNGILVDFACLRNGGSNSGYRLQLQSNYYNGTLYTRSSNGDSGTWSAWKSLIDSGGGTINGNLTVSGMLYNHFIEAGSDRFITLSCGDYVDARKTSTANTFIPMRASAFTVQSSRKYKTNIEDMDAEDARNILKLRPVTFDYVEEENGTNCKGLIAEEVDEVDKYPVLYIDGQPDGLDYSKFVPQLIKLCQIQQEQIDEQKKRLDAQQEQIDKLLAKVK